VSFFAELKRRNVFRVGIAYAVGAWILVQVADILFEAIGTPSWAMQTLLVFLGLGFFVAIFFAWAFELTPEGIKREKAVDRTQSIAPQTGKKLNNAILALMVIALAYFVWESRFAGRQPATTKPASAGAAAPTTPEPAVQDAPSKPSAPATGEKSVAVLPFTHRSPDPNDIYFTDGVHDDLLTQLAKIGDLKVISRTSVLEYRDTTKNLKQIGDELGVANIMEGAVQRSGDRVRINVQLIDADTDKHLWAETYDRQLTAENLFDIQSEISRAIAAALKSTLTEEELASTQEIPTENVEAYELYLQARRFALGETLIGYNTAIDLYERALELDAQFKLAWVGLAHAHITNYWVGGGDPADREKAWEVIERARVIDPDFPELYMALGAYYYWGFLDYDQALANLDRAALLMPGNGDVHMWRGWALRRSGQWDQALSAMRESLRLDPRVLFNWVELGQTHFYQHRFEEARDALEQARALSRDDFWAKQALATLEILESGDVHEAQTLMLGAQHTAEPGWVDTYLMTSVYGRKFEEALQALESLPEGFEQQRSFLSPTDLWRAQILHYMGRHEEARSAAEAGLAEVEQFTNANPGDYRQHQPRALAYAILGRADEAVTEVQAAIANAPTDAVDVFLLGINQAEILAIAGRVEETIELLEPMLEPPSMATVHSVATNPAFDDIRKHPDFVAMMERHR
jgi:TolB-like protein/Flp pilus assembly protein TadD